jgi:hypothetical protein
MGMFEAFVIVCAATLAQEIDRNSCMQLNDSWGPYRTEENCDIRSRQMVDEVINGDLNPVLFSMYSNVIGVNIELLYAEGHCEYIDKDSI